MENNLTIQIIKEISEINPNNKYIAEIKGSKTNNRNASRWHQTYFEKMQSQNHGN